MADIVNKRPGLRPGRQNDAKDVKSAKPANRASWPAEGPHARPDLINEEATPGTGLFSGPGARDKEADPGTG